MASVLNLRDRIKAALAEGDYDLALLLAQRILHHYPHDFETTGLLGQLHLEQGDFEKARDAYEVVLKADPERVLARWALATIAEQQGDLDRAMLMLERAFNLDSTNRGLAQEITRLNARMSHTRPAEPGAWEHAMGRQFMLMKKYDEAAAQFEAALRANSTPEVEVGLAHALWRAKLTSEAGRVARGVLAHDPDCVKALAIAAGAAFSQGDQEFVPLLTRASALDPGNSVAQGIFQEATLIFPEIGRDVEIPEEESRALQSPEIGSPAPPKTTPKALPPPAESPGSQRAGGSPGWEMGRVTPGTTEEPWAKKRLGSREESSGWLSSSVAAKLDALLSSEETTRTDETSIEEPPEPARGEEVLRVEPMVQAPAPAYIDEVPLVVPDAEESSEPVHSRLLRMLDEETTTPIPPAAEGTGEDVTEPGSEESGGAKGPDVSHASGSVEWYNPEVQVDEDGVVPSESSPLQASSPLEEVASVSPGIETQTPPRDEPGANASGSQVQLTGSSSGSASGGQSQGVVGKPASERSGDVALHVAFAQSYQNRGHFDFAADEYRTALRLDASTAPVVREAAQAMIAASPDNLKVRWLLGDTLASGGQFRQAVEQYLFVLRTRREAPTEKGS